MSAPTLSITMPTNNAAPQGRILCVDDEPNILRALAWLLQKDFEVITAASAREALELLPDADFDVVISDQRMPEMDGIEFLNRVRALAPRAMRILLTGYSDLQAVMRSANEAEIFRYVSKPWDVTELPAIVAQAAAIARQPAPPPAAASVPGAAPGRPPRMLVLDDDAAGHSAVEMSAGDLAEVIHATTPVDALRILESEEIGVILAESVLGGMDLTHLLCLIRRRYPQIVSVVLTGSPDGTTIARLINQGQIFRFVKKPLKAGELRLTVKSALARRAELLANPALGERYQVAAPDAAAIAFGELALAGADLPRGTGAGSMLAQVGEFMRRMFGN